MYAFGHGEGIGAWRRFYGNEDRGIAIVPGSGVVTLRAQFCISNITYAHQRAVLGAHHQVAEIPFLAHVGAGGQVHGDIVALYLAHACQVVVLAQDITNVNRSHSQRGHAPRVQPDAHGEDLVHRQPRLGDARDGLQLGLHHAQQVVGDLCK